MNSSMRLLLFILIPFNFLAQENREHTLSLSGGYENHGWRAHGWNVTVNATKQFESIPRLNAGFNLAYGNSIYDSKATGEYSPRVVDATTSISLSSYHVPYYAFINRIRMGIESSYALLKRKDHQLEAGLGLVLEGLTRYKESGVNVWSDYDSITHMDSIYTEDYAFDRSFSEIKKPFSILVVPQVSYAYRLSDQLSLFVRSSLFIRMQRYFYYGGCFQANFGLRYHW